MPVDASDIQVSEYGVGRRVCGGCGREHDGGYYCPQPHSVEDCLAALAERVLALEATVLKQEKEANNA